MHEIFRKMSDAWHGKDRIQMPTKKQIGSFISVNKDRNPTPPYDVRDSLKLFQSDHVLPSEVAKYGQINWDIVSANNYPPNTPKYLGNLIHVMLDGNSYQRKVDEPFMLNNQWRVEYAGNHRLLILRMLGPQIVEDSGMNAWVTIELLDK